MVYHSPKCPRTQFSILPYAKGPNFQFSQMIFDRMTALRNKNFKISHSELKSIHIWPIYQQAASKQLDLSA